MDPERIRHRRGQGVVVDGVPLASAETTSSLLPLDIVGRWLADNSSVFHGRLLDLGAGNQPYRAWYERLADFTVAIDVAPAPGLDIVAFSAPLPFPDHVFDVCLCTSVLEHVDDPEQTVAEIRRTLRPGGSLVISVPFLYPTHEAPFDYWRTTYYGLRRILERHGLVVASIAAQGGPFVLVGHYIFGAVTQAISRMARTARPLAWLMNSRAVRAVVVSPQRALGRRTGYELTGLSRTASLGFMAVAVKPAS